VGFIAGKASTVLLPLAWSMSKERAGSSSLHLLKGDKSETETDSEQHVRCQKTASQAWCTSLIPAPGRLRHEN
jgi:hypothetical protein